MVTEAMQQGIEQGRLDRAYAERNVLAIAFCKLALACGMSAGRGYDSDPDKDWDPVWRHLVYVDVPDVGQLSWHISPDQIHLLDDLPQYNGKWDGTFISRQHDWSKQVKVPACIGALVDAQTLRFALSQALPLAAHTLQVAFAPTNVLGECVAHTLVNHEGFDSRQAANEWLDAVGQMVGIKS